MRILIRAGDASFAAAAAFLLGVFSANEKWSAYALALAGIFAVAVAFVWRRDRLWNYALFSVCALAAGFVYCHAYVGWDAARTHMPPGNGAAFFGVATEEPKAAGKFMMITVTLSSPYAGTIDMFTTPNSAQIRYGDELWIRGSLTPAEDAGEPPAMFLPEVRVIAENKGFWLMAAMIDLKAMISAAIVRMLPPDQAALLAGIMVGSMGTISAALKAQMEASGTSYIVNMYGYKIAIITAAFAAAFKDHVPRRMLLFATLVVVALFVFASGGTVSAVRAAVMGSFAVVARGVGRTFSARNAVTFAALGMVILNATLLTDAGFQLSFLSFLGIYYLGPPINNCFRWTDGGALQWKEHAMLSLATNLAILPVVMNTFGEFSLASFVSNILIMIPWLAVIAFGAPVALLGSAVPALAFCAAQVVSVLLRYELFIIRAFAAINIPAPSVFASPLAIAVYYGVLLIFAYHYAAPPQKNH